MILESYWKHYNANALSMIACVVAYLNNGYAGESNFNGLKNLTFHFRYSSLV